MKFAQSSVLRMATTTCLSTPIQKPTPRNFVLPSLHLKPLLRRSRHRITLNFPSSSATTTTAPHNHSNNQPTVGGNDPPTVPESSNSRPQVHVVPSSAFFRLGVSVTRMRFPRAKGTRLARPVGGVCLSSGINRPLFRRGRMARRHVARPCESIIRMWSRYRLSIRVERRF